MLAEKTVATLLLNLKLCALLTITCKTFDDVLFILSKMKPTKIWENFQNCWSMHYLILIEALKKSNTAVGIKRIMKLSIENLTDKKQEMFSVSLQIIVECRKPSLSFPDNPNGMECIVTL